MEEVTCFLFHLEKKKDIKKMGVGDFPGVLVAKTHAPDTGVPGSIPGQELGPTCLN